MKFLLLFALLSAQAFGDACIFSGSSVKCLKTRIDLNGTAALSVGSPLDPSVTATYGGPGALHSSSGGNGGLYVKTTGFGTDTNWDRVYAQSKPHNYIINGAPDLFQRGTSFASIGAVNQYIADRFLYSATTTSAVVTLSRSTDVPTFAQSGFQGSYSMQVAVTTADATVAAGDLSQIQYRMEGHDWAALKGKRVNVGFWFKTSKAGTYGFSIRNGANDRSRAYTFTASLNTWEHFSFPTALDPTGGTDEFANGIGAKFSIALMAGSTYQTSGTTWQTGDYVTSGTLANGMDNTSNTFNIAQFSVTEGSGYVRFQRSGGTIGGELLLAQRYYEKTFNTDVAPVQNSGTSVGSIVAVGQVANQAFGAMWHFKAAKRTTPTVTTFSPNAATANWGTNTTTPTASTSVAGMGSVVVLGGTSVTAGNAYQIHAVADAEL